MGRRYTLIIIGLQVSVKAPQPSNYPRVYLWCAAADELIQHVRKDHMPIVCISIKIIKSELGIIWHGAEWVCLGFMSFHKSQ
ncbi:unnamed protein product, partial [Vitis vinifera]